MSEAMNEQASQYQRLVEKCWTDEAFKQRLMADPRGTLTQEGWTIPEDISIKVVEETDEVKYLLVPARQESLDDEALESVAGGGVIVFPRTILPSISDGPLSKAPTDSPSSGALPSIPGIPGIPSTPFK